MVGSKIIHNIQLEESALWKSINKKYITEEKIKDLSNFKSNGINYKISLWNPETNGLRYLKTLIYNLCASLSKKNWIQIQKTRNRHIGNPITIKFNNQKICLDYLQAIYELEFIEKNVLTDNFKILEIGAGYGRTCHTILSNNPKINSYYILDLKNCLALSKNYLNKALSKSLFKKIRFLSIKEINLLNDFTFNLCINIDSLAEMKNQVVYNYLKFINMHCDYFYVKNPIGKYLDRTLVNHFQGRRINRLALSCGILNKILDVNDNKVVKLHVKKYLSAYQPGIKWKLVADSWARPFSYYWQAIYKKIREGNT